MFALLLCALLTVPAPAAKPGPLSGTCSFGTIEHSGNTISITGGSWTATGRVKGDLVRVVWVLNGRTAEAVYQIVDGNLVGVWGWSDRLEEVTETDICGKIYQETIWITRPGVDQ